MTPTPTTSYTPTASATATPIAPPTATAIDTATATVTESATLTATVTQTSTETTTPTETPTSLPAATLTFAPLDDATIQSAAPDTNAGSATSVVVDNSPVQNFLIKFQVDGLAGRTVTHATLKLHNVSSSDIGGYFYRVNDQSWTEETVNWNNVPAADATEIAALGAVAIGNWYSVDLTSLITADGTYSLRVMSTSTNGADYSSKEGANPPVLEVVVAD
ncbi:MAG TPA: DNRLRE domain-containing protein, partial [Bellilinea sp.]|nr:DNRLRE domain-containing protein [Bellilinea sp.]